MLVHLLLGRRETLGVALREGGGEEGVVGAGGTVVVRLGGVGLLGLGVVLLGSVRLR